MLGDSPGRQVLGKDILGKGHVELFLESLFLAQGPGISLVILEHMLCILGRWGLEVGSLSLVEVRL